MSPVGTVKSTVPMYATMNRVPGGAMLIPLVLGSIIGTFAPEALGIGSFTTALFKESALPLIGLLIFATGMQITLRSSGAVLAHAGVILVGKSLIPAALVVALGASLGKEGLFGVSILALLVVVDNSNGGLWLAFTGKYGTKTDRGAYIASAINDGPFFTLVFLGASGLADIPGILILAAVVPLILGMVVGNLDPQWTDVMRPTASIVIPFFAFALGTGIDLRSIVVGGLPGLVVGAISSVITGCIVYAGYRFLLRRGKMSGIGFAAGTTAGNAVATPAIVAQADPSFEPFVAAATAQVAAAVLVSSIVAPLMATWVLKRSGGLAQAQAEAESEAGQPADSGPAL